MHSAPKRMAAYAAYGQPAPLSHSFDAYSHPSEASPYPHRGARPVVPPLLQDGVVATADEVDSAVRQYFAHGQHPLPVGCDADAIKLFVGNIPKQMSEAELRSVFTHVGPVARVSLVRISVRSWLLQMRTDVVWPVSITGAPCRRAMGTRARARAARSCGSANSSMPCSPS